MSAQYTASIIVANLKTTARYVDQIVMQLYSDSGLTDLVSNGSCPVSWDGTYNNQVGAWTFRGLKEGSTYYLKVGVAAPVSGYITWSPTYTQLVSYTKTVPSSTYSGTFTATQSGVSYLVTAASVPTDFKQFEAVWTKDGSTPSTDTQPLWTGGITQGGNTTMFFVGGIPGETVTAYIRATTTTAGAQQDWTDIGGAIAIPTTFSFSGTFTGSI